MVGHPVLPQAGFLALAEAKTKHTPATFISALSFADVLRVSLKYIHAETGLVDM